MYRSCLKRAFDVALSLLALIILSPLFIVLILLGAVKMKGNPFFTQERPGKNGEIFKLIKFRSMTNECDENGELLPDEVRLINYGIKLRSTSLDELPELINIIKGDMSIVGPRPLMVKYLPLYNEMQRHRHDVRPGLTGLAQINGRNAITWTKRFELDVEYVNTYSFLLDAKIIIKTFACVIKREGISGEDSVTMDDFTGDN